MLMNITKLELVFKKNIMSGKKYCSLRTFPTITKNKKVLKMENNKLTVSTAAIISSIKFALICGLPSSPFSIKSNARPLSHLLCERESTSTFDCCWEACLSLV